MALEPEEIETHYTNDGEVVLAGLCAGLDRAASTKRVGGCLRGSVLRSDSGQDKVLLFCFRPGDRIEIASGNHCFGGYEYAVSERSGGPAIQNFSGLTANHAFRAASQSDAAVVPAQSVDVKLHAPGHRLHFPAGTVSITGVGPNITFNRSIEFVVKFE